MRTLIKTWKDSNKFWKSYMKWFIVAMASLMCLLLPNLFFEPGKVFFEYSWSDGFSEDSNLWLCAYYFILLFIILPVSLVKTWRYADKFAKENDKTNKKIVERIKEIVGNDEV